jgi:diphthamide synthase subunit DPH2
MSKNVKNAVRICPYCQKTDAFGAMMHEKELCEKVERFFRFLGKRNIEVIRYVKGLKGLSTEVKKLMKPVKEGW